MGRAVYAALFKHSKVDVRSFFRPGQTALLYTVDDEPSTDFRPTVLKRPKEEIEDPMSMVQPNTDTKVINTLARVLSYIRPSNRTSGAVDKPKTRETGKQALLETMLGTKDNLKASGSAQPFQTTHISSVSVASEEDIFADAGTDYVCDLKRKKQKASAKPSTDPPQEAPFISDLMVQSSHIKRFLSTVLQEVDEEEGEVRDRDEGGMLKMDGKTEKQIDPTALPDHYAECYPGFHQGYAAAVVDSDDEDFSHMEIKGKSLSRFDFGTDEEWSKYKQRMEQLPKAAFQFGVKMSDGRKTHSKLVEKHRSKQKFDAQLNKIERLLKDQGHSHEAAFRSNSKSEKPSETTVPVTKTRRRIDIYRD